MVLGGDQVAGGSRGGRLRQGDDRRQEGEGATSSARHVQRVLGWMNRMNF